MEPKMPNIAVLVAATLDRPGRSPEELEQDLDRAIGVLEAEGAIGPAVGCDLERSVLDMRFSIEGEDSAAIHRSIGNISETIDEALGGRVTTSVGPSSQVELACG
jgi:hypothetical protein